MGKPKKLRKLIKAAKMGKTCAMYRLGICFETGTMTEKDLTKAASILPLTEMITPCTKGSTFFLT